MRPSSALPRVVAFVLHLILVVAVGFNGLGVSAMAMTLEHSHEAMQVAGNAELSSAVQPDVTSTGQTRAMPGMPGCHELATPSANGPSAETAAMAPAGNGGSLAEAEGECCSAAGCSDCGCLQVAAAPMQLTCPPKLRGDTSLGTNGQHLVAAGLPSRLDRPPIS